MVCTFFEAFNVPVFWPILVMYFVMLFCITMKRQIKVRASRPHGERRGRQGQWQRGWPVLSPVTREGDAEPALSTRGSRQLCAGLGRGHGAPSRVSQDLPDEDVPLNRPGQTGPHSREGHPTPGPVLRAGELAAGGLVLSPGVRTWPIGKPF